MKRVSLKVAKAIKEAGYPQDQSWNFETLVITNNGCIIPLLNMEDDVHNDEECYSCPTYLEVWLWLWRDKKLNIDILKAWDTEVKSWVGEGRDTKMFLRHDPEEVIISAIEYLVDNDLI